MHVNSGISHYSSNHPSVLTNFEGYYLKNVKHLFWFLVEKKMTFFASILATFLIEPQHAIRAGYLMQRGLGEKKFVNLNPKHLFPNQLKCAPVLFIHGDQSNSGIFAPMIDHVAKEAPYTPLFTIDLVSADGIVSAENHLSLIVDKINEIAALYRPASMPKISFVGHSSGGDILPHIIRVMKKNKWPQLGTAIKIGSVFTKNEAQDFFSDSFGKIMEIVGTKDVFEGDDSHLPDKLVVVSGHLGLLFNNIVLDRVANEIRKL